MKGKVPTNGNGSAANYGGASQVPLLDIAPPAADVPVEAKQRWDGGVADDLEMLELAADCAAELLNEPQSEERLGTVLARLTRRLDLSAFASFRAQEDGGFKLEAAKGLAPDAPVRLAAALPLLVAELAARTRRTLVLSVPDETEPLAQLLHSLGFLSGSVTALANEGRTVGALVFASRSSRAFSSRAAALIDVVGSCLGSAYSAPGRASSRIDEGSHEFLTVLAHELRNPLAPVRNALEIMRVNDRHPSAVERAAYAIIERQLEQIAWLADDLLDADRVAVGHVALERQNVALDGVIESAAERSKPWLETFRHELAIELPAQPIVLEADRICLERIFSNLLNCAARQMGRGGRITIAARRRGGSVEVLVRAKAVDETVQSLRDLFSTPEGEAVLNRGSQGALTAGVALVRHFVELHGGTIVATDGPDCSVEFIVTLPLTRAALEAPLVLEESGPGNVGPLRILVADDNADSAESMGTLLRLMGNEVRVANDGLDAVEQASSFRPDIVLLDIGMPRLDGYEAARRIREQAWSRETLLVAVTGWGPRGDDDGKAAAAGFDRRFTKPLDPAELRKLVGNERPMR